MGSLNGSLLGLVSSASGPQQGGAQRKEKARGPCRAACGPFWWPLLCCSVLTPRGQEEETHPSVPCWCPVGGVLAPLTCCAHGFLAHSASVHSSPWLSHFTLFSDLFFTSTHAIHPSGCCAYPVRSLSGLVGPTVVNGTCKAAGAAFCLFMSLPRWGKHGCRRGL